MNLCEVCGKPLREAPRPTIIEGASLKVCSSCAKLGTPAPPPRPTPPQAPPSVPRAVPRPRPPTPILEEPSLELRQDFNLVLRQAREKAGLPQEELGRRINEKPSVIRLLESGKLKPSDLLARKLEHFLRIRLFVPAEEMV